MSNTPDPSVCPPIDPALVAHLRHRLRAEIEVPRTEKPLWVVGECSGKRSVLELLERLAREQDQKADPNVHIASKDSR